MQSNLISHLLLPLSLHKHVLCLLQVVFLGCGNHVDLDDFHEIRSQRTHAHNGSFEAVDD